jgi:hypothetical protein
VCRAERAHSAAAVWLTRAHVARERVPRGVGGAPQAAAAACRRAACVASGAHHCCVALGRFGSSACWPRRVCVQSHSFAPACHAAPHVTPRRCSTRVQVGLSQTQAQGAACSSQHAHGWLPRLPLLFTAAP